MLGALRDLKHRRAEKLHKPIDITVGECVQDLVQKEVDHEIGDYRIRLGVVSHIDAHFQRGFGAQLLDHVDEKYIVTFEKSTLFAAVCQIITAVYGVLYGPYEGKQPARASLQDRMAFPDYHQDDFRGHSTVLTRPDSEDCGPSGTMVLPITHYLRSVIKLEGSQMHWWQRWLDYLRVPQAKRFLRLQDTSLPATDRCLMMALLAMQQNPPYEEQQMRIRISNRLFDRPGQEELAQQIDTECRKACVEVPIQDHWLTFENHHTVHTCAGPAEKGHQIARLLYQKT